MITKVIPIGNSKGIRIPNHILKSLNIDSQLEMIVNQDNDEIILKPVHTTREGWDDAFKKMRVNSDDDLIIEDSLDLHEWEW